MVLRTSYDENQVCQLLAGDPDAIRLGLALIHQHLRGRLGRWLHRRFPCLRADDLADVWGETLLAVLQAARAGPCCPGCGASPGPAPAISCGA